MSEVDVLRERKKEKNHPKVAFTKQRKTYSAANLAADFFAVLVAYWP